MKPHPKNPRKGNVEDIAESLKENGQFRPLLVQRSTNYIVAGNHTFLAAQSLKWKAIDVIYLDVDNKRALKILLADNRLSDKATYDTEILADILKSLPDPAGTGYDSDDIRAIVAGIDDSDLDLVIDTLKPATIEFKESKDELSLNERVDELQDRQALREELGEELPEVQVEQAAVSIASIQDQLEPLEQFIWDSNNWYGIPDLLPSMLVKDLPDKLNTWGGEEATPDDGVTTWLWNFGLASSKNIPWNRTIMSFFTYDTKFGQWWDKPAYNAARVIHNGIDRAIVPDFSMWLDDPRFYHIQAAYRGQWLGRFMQEAGVRIIPRIMWCDPESIRIGLHGIPKHAPIIAVCIQAIDKKEIEKQMSAEGLRIFIKELKPECLLVYSGNPGKKLIESAHLPKQLDVRFVDNYAAVRRHVVFDKPTGKLAVQKAQKAQARVTKRREEASKKKTKKKP